MANPGATTPAVAPPPAPADVAIVAALPIEVAPFLARFKQVRKYALPKHTIVEGNCGEKLVALIAAGVGTKAARRGAELLLAGHRPRWLISAGFAGALDPDLKRNDTVLANRLVSEEEGEPALDIDLAIPPHDEGAHRVRVGCLVTVSRIIRAAAEKAEVRSQSGADIVDMESYPIAGLCAERNLRFLSIRVVSDEASVDLPPEVLTILGPTGSFRLGAAMGALWRRPSSLKDLWALRDHAHEAAERLGEVLSDVIARLP